jgi:ubiquinol-cytochrome c reductase cytochrome c subunit
VRVGAFVSIPLFVGAAVLLLQPRRAIATDRPPPTFEHGVLVGPLPPKDRPPLQDPRQLYLRDCATCHGGDARGTPRGPTLVGKGRAGVFYWVSTGRMPLLNTSDKIGRKPPLYPPDVVNKLVDYVVALTGGSGPDIPRLQAGNVSDGLHLFGLECAACHAWSGSGSIVFTGKAPTVAPATPEQAAAAIRIGPGQMPAFGPAALDDQQLSDVVAYVQTLKNKKDAGGWGIFHRGPTTEGAAALIVGLGALLLAVGWIGNKAKSRAHF